MTHRSFLTSLHTLGEHTLGEHTTSRIKCLGMVGVGAVPGCLMSASFSARPFVWEPTLPRRLNRIQAPRISMPTRSVQQCHCGAL